MSKHLPTVIGDLVVNEVMPRAIEPPDPYRWIEPSQIAELALLQINNRISHGAAKQIIAELYEHGGEVFAIIEHRGLWQSNDTGELEGWVTDAIAVNPKAAAEFREGNAKALNAIKGAVMKASKGKANPKFVDEMLRSRLSP